MKPGTKCTAIGQHIVSSSQNSALFAHHMQHDIKTDLIYFLMHFSGLIVNDSSSTDESKPVIFNSCSSSEIAFLKNTQILANFSPVQHFFFFKCPVSFQINKIVNFIMYQNFEMRVNRWRLECTDPLMYMHIINVNIKLKYKK